MSTNAEDYMMRYFQQLGKVLAALMGFHDKKNYQLAIEQISQVFDTWFNEDVEKFEQLSKEELIERLTTTPSPNFEKEKAMAELLYQRALTFIKMEKPALVIKPANASLLLYKNIDKVSGEFSLEIQQKIADLDSWSTQ